MVTAASGGLPADVLKVGAEQLRVQSAASSTLPSQLSSEPLSQTSKAAGVPGEALHTTLLPAQTSVPARRQAPRPALQAPPVDRHTPPQSNWPEGHVLRQTPPLQVTLPPVGARQTFPHEPQLPAADRRSASQPLAEAPSQLPKPAVQVRPQVLPAQTGAALRAGGHVPPQRPQLTGSVRVSTHLPPHGTCPTAQVEAQVPPVQRVAPPQMLPQRPQLAGSLFKSRSQPFAVAPSQFANPTLQAMPHTPAVQAEVAFEGPGLAFPLRTQFARSARVSMQELPQGLWPVGHVVTHAPLAQRCPPVHALPQRPQFAESDLRSRSQPLVALPSQSPKPATQAPRMHREFTQTPEAFA